MSIERILHQPQSGAACLGCGKHLGLYLVRGQYLSLRASCTKDRVETYAPVPDVRPSWVSNLYDEVLHEIRYKEHQEKQQYTVSWDLVKCSECGRMMKRRDAKYRSPETDDFEDRPETILAPATQMRDGTLIVYPTDGVPQIHNSVCFGCYGAPGE